ncbi:MULTISPECIES: flagellar hook assembly protein FlgD [unclassified Duganella]|uniref:flagellar hook assembly protein FlgD n=1 Tax=unclassified Duganella TaxID=2636909 RepID=UPI0006FED870|nr:MULTISPECIES: flagellar hook capping FlgD N-terminal domain-containing protein [unclassified Duganella]KQV61716.1 flagellar basal body rod modification protein [Duganella sp. Root336D2]KRB84222.1 flagellar basal body rod modification protein [Duganella sp. Root198D2]
METNLFTNAAAQGSNPTGVALNGASNEGRDMFTKLLVAQIKNQDPLSPQDPSQFVQQLTQLSQTEALQNLASLTTANASVLQSMQVLAMGAQVGSDVMVQSSQVTLDGHKVVGEATLGSSSAKTSLVLTGSNGQQYEIVMGTLPAGTHQFSIDPVALGLPAGSYSMRIASESNPNAPLAVLGRLDSVQVGAAGSVTVKIDTVGEVSPSAITAFRGKTPTTAI